MNGLNTPQDGSELYRKILLWLQVAMLNTQNSYKTSPLGSPSSDHEDFFASTPMIYQQLSHMDAQIQQLAGETLQHMTGSQPDVYLHLISQLYAGDHSLSSQMLSHSQSLELMSKVASLAKEQSDTRSASEEVLATLAHEIIRQEYASELTVDSIAKLLYTNKDKLQKAYKTLYGTTIHKALTKQRLTVAHGLLQSTQKPVNEIATEVGYKKTSHFIKLFQQEYGVTPGQFLAKETNASTS